jgi:hypothetical protein
MNRTDQAIARGMIQRRGAKPFFEQFSRVPISAQSIIVLLLWLARSRQWLREICFRAIFEPASLRRSVVYTIPAKTPRLRHGKAWYR